MDAIEPSTYDVILASSGMVECLLASALAKAGKSVLLMDGADLYGSMHASFTFAGLSGSQDPSLNPHASSQREGPAQHDVQVEGQGVSTRLNPDYSLPVTHVESCWAAGQDITQTRGFILDLAPKAVYQAEALVDVLVKTRAHNYVEFKAVDSSFIYQGGVLRPIPASRAEIFKDKSLSLQDKRVLMAFLSSCMAAKDGQGPLKDVMASDQPLVQVLTQQGLSPPLQDIILYGIVHADHTQPHSTATSHSSTQSCQNSHSPASTTSQPPAQHAASASGSDVPTPFEGDTSHAVTARQGLQTLGLFAESLGRFGANAAGAFMVPGYGSGSLPEALVRHCAVKGSVTVLRQRVHSVLVGPPVLQSQPPQQTTAGEGDSQLGSTAETLAAGSGPAPDSGAHAEGEGQQEQSPQAQQHSGLAAGPAAAEAGSDVVQGVVLDSGQVLHCGEALVLGQHVARVAPSQPDTAGSGTTAIGRARTRRRCVARAVAVLDSSVVPDKHGLATLTVPPSASPAPHQQPVYGLQLTSSASVTSHNRYLLYLSTGVPVSPQQQQSDSDSAACTNPSVRMLLEPVLGLFAELPNAPDSQDSVEVTDAESGPQGSGPAASTTTTAAHCNTIARPKVLHAHYYLQNLGPAPEVAAAQAAAAGSSSQHSDAGAGDGVAWPANLIVCPGAAGTLFGYGDEVAEAERLLRQHFPGVPWLLDPEPEGGAEAGAGEEEEGGEAHQHRSEGVGEEDEAIDELQKALGDLLAAQPAVGASNAVV